MATAATISRPAIKEYLKSGKSDPSDEVIANAIDQLDSDEGQFANNVKQVGTWAIQIDEAFDRVSRAFKALVQEFGKDFPALSKFLDEWNSYNSRWVSHLSLSRSVASEHIAILTRFDQVFIDMVLSIKTEQDRLDVIKELGEFINEDHDRSAEMSQGFLDLKRDVEDFVIRFDAWLEKTGTELAERAKELQGLIDGLKEEIESLEKQIIEATAALLVSAAGASTLVGVIGLVVAAAVVTALVAQRIIKGNELENRKKELEDVNRKQKALAKIKSEFDLLRPDIALICEKLVLFAEIWSSVRNQAVQFQETLKGGMGALTNMRFKMELRLARDLCTPLKAGLEKYATELTKKGE